MLLAIDIGNTSIKFGIFSDNSLVSKFSIPTDRSYAAAEIQKAVGDTFSPKITSVIACSVVPEIESPITNFLSQSIGVEPQFVTSELDFGLDIRYQPPSAVGTDRLVNSFAAAEKYGVPVIVVSLGTATTIDVINEKRQLLGGVIAPGMATTAKALHLNTSKLPEVNIEKPPSIIANTTINSIQSGIFFSQAAMLEGIVRRISGEIGQKPTVVVTGGFAQMIADESGIVDIVDENLLLEGLNMLFRRLYTDDRK